MSSKPVDLYVFRHGETDWNVEGRMQGHTNTSLNETGRLQAHTLKEKLKNIQVDHIICSDLNRAVETATIALGDRGLPIHQTKELREIFLGDVEGMLRKELIKQIGEDQWKSYANPSNLDFAFSSGESKRDHLKRLRTIIEKTIIEAKCSQLAVSTHGGALVTFAHSTKGAPEEEIPIPNGALYHFVYDNGEWFYKSFLG